MSEIDYSKIFASGSMNGEIKDMPDDSYLRGWGYLSESEPPPMEYFNYLHNLIDRKFLNLDERLGTASGSLSESVEALAKRIESLESMVGMIVSQEEIDEYFKEV